MTAQVRDKGHLTGTGAFGVSLSERPGRRTVWFLGLACRLPLLLLSPRLGSSCIFGLKDTSSAGLQQEENRFLWRGCKNGASKYLFKGRIRLPTTIWLKHIGSITETRALPGRHSTEEARIAMAKMFQIIQSFSSNERAFRQ